MAEDHRKYDDHILRGIFALVVANGGAVLALLSAVPSNFGNKVLLGAIVEALRFFDWGLRFAAMAYVGMLGYMILEVHEQTRFNTSLKVASLVSFLIGSGGALLSLFGGLSALTSALSKML